MASSSTSTPSRIPHGASPLLEEHIIYKSPTVVAGLTKCPATPGHIIITCKESKPLMTNSAIAFTNLLRTARFIATKIGHPIKASRVGLACDGGECISLLPLNGVGKDWDPIVNNIERYWTTYPGLLSTETGPRSTDDTLDKIQNLIIDAPGTTKPMNTYFEGNGDDDNLFARIVRGEVKQWRVWEDKKHVAFLTPFGNTPGFTVLVPRKHLGSDIFLLVDEEYTGLVEAAHTVAQLIKKAFGVLRCGMFFEGMEIDYAHVKLVPVHASASNGGLNGDGEGWGLL